MLPGSVFKTDSNNLSFSLGFSVFIFVFDSFMKQILIILFKHSVASCDKHYFPTPVTTDLC